jgi:uncharacterized protein (TIGR02246 family)
MLIVAAVAARASGQGMPDAEMQKLADEYMQAWAKGDAKGVAAVYAADAIRVGPDGALVLGRAAIEKGYAEAFAGPWKGSKIAITLGQMRRAGPDVFVGEGTYQVTGGNPPAGMPTSGRYVNTIVRQSGRLAIAGNAAVPAPAGTGGK